MFWLLRPSKCSNFEISTAYLTISCKVICDEINALYENSFIEEAADYIPPITSQIKYIASGIIYWNI